MAEKKLAGELSPEEYERALREYIRKFYGPKEGEISGLLTPKRDRGMRSYADTWQGKNRERGSTDYGQTETVYRTIGAILIVGHREEAILS